MIKRRINLGKNDNIIPNNKKLKVNNIKSSSFSKFEYLIFGAFLAISVIAGFRFYYTPSFEVGDCLITTRYSFVKVIAYDDNYYDFHIQQRMELGQGVVVLADSTTDSNTYYIKKHIAETKFKKLDCSYIITKQEL